MKEDRELEDLIQSIVDQITGLPVSVDLSTDDDPFRRVFGTVTGVMKDTSGSVIILVEAD